MTTPKGIPMGYAEAAQDRGIPPVLVASASPPDATQARGDAALREALAGLLGLLELLLARDDVPSTFRYAMTANHRVVTARAALASAATPPSGAGEYARGVDDALKTVTQLHAHYRDKMIGENAQYGTPALADAAAAIRALAPPEGAQR